ncbi:hypothetical protein RS9917_03843 [Synechococcus sp. RS9917]|nr:hypothetical protein RS9917_03843 [Synechococcus sp. RS9917]
MRPSLPGGENSESSPRVSMPIRWYGPANPADPTYRHFSRVVNLTLHGMAFAAINSGLWFVQGLRHPWPHLALVTEIWLALLIAHLLVVLRLRPAADAAASVSSSAPND